MCIWRAVRLYTIHLASIIFLMPPNPRFISVIIVVMPYVGLRTEAVSFKVTNVEGDGLRYNSSLCAIQPTSR